MTLFDFFQAGELPAPVVSVGDAAEIARSRFGLDAIATPLGSQQDANFLLAAPGGAALGVLKIANPAFTLIEIEAQDAAARFIAEAEDGVRTAKNLELSGAATVAEIKGPDGGTLFARIIT